MVASLGRVYSCTTVGRTLRAMSSGIASGCSLQVSTVALTHGALHNKPEHPVTATSWLKIILVDVQTKRSTPRTRASHKSVYGRCICSRSSRSCFWSWSLFWCGLQQVSSSQFSSAFSIKSACWWSDTSYTPRRSSKLSTRISSLYRHVAQANLLCKDVLIKWKGLVLVRETCRGTAFLGLIYVIEPLALSIVQEGFHLYLQPFHHLAPHNPCRETKLVSQFPSQLILSLIRCNDSRQK